MIIQDITRLIVPLTVRKELPANRSKGCYAKSTQLTWKFYVSLERMSKSGILCTY